MAQYLMYIDCHLSNTELYKYLFFVDMDEFVIPALVSTHSFYTGASKYSFILYQSWHIRIA